MNKLIGKPESKLFMGMAMSSVPRVATAESLVRVNVGVFNFWTFERNCVKSSMVTFEMKCLKRYFHMARYYLLRM